MLFLSFGSRDLPSLGTLMDEFRVALEAQEGAPIHVFLETFNAYGASNDPAFDKTMEEFLRKKYGSRTPNLVVAVGGRPLDFLLPRRAKLFPGAKLLYVTVFRESVPDATGIILELNLLPTAEIALQHNPGTKRLLLITGSSPADQTGIPQLAGALKERFRREGRAIEVETLAPMTYSDVQRRLAGLPRDTVGLFVFYYVDSAGQVFSPSRALPVFSRVSSRPIYSGWDADIGRGSVGGRVIGIAEIGQALAGQAARVLRGEPPGTIPPVRGEFQRYMFDWKQMKRWGIQLDQLPPGSTVIDREYTAWELYRWQIGGGLGLILAEAALIALLLHLRRVRRRAVQQLAHSHRLEAVMAELSAAFLNLPAEVMNAQVDSALEHLLAALEVDRISVFEFSADGQRLQPVFAKIVAGPPAPLAEAHSSELAWLMTKLFRGERVVATRLEDLPPEAEEVRRVAAGVGIRSLAILPLHGDGVTFGKLTCATVQRHILWTPDTLKYLQVVANVFGHALKRRRAEEALVRSEQLKASILSSLSSQIAVVDRAGRIIAANDRWRAFQEKFDGHPDWIREERMTFGPCEGCEPECVPASGALQGARGVWEGRRDSFEMEYECAPQRGLKRWFLLTVTRLQGAEGGAVISHHDVTESKQNEQAIRELSGKLITAQEEERARIARELHDDINQQLALLAIDLQLLDQSLPPGPTHTRLEQLWKKTNEISADIQGLSHQLHSAKLEHLGLISALRELCQDFRKQQQMAIEFSAAHVPSTLDIGVSLSLFRIAQECLRNVGKHSQARKVRVELEGSASGLTLRISDDGVGFAAAPASRGGGLGLVSMQERLRLVGGELVVGSAEAQGTVVEARVPVREDVDRGLPSVGWKRGDEEPALQGGVHGLNQIRSHS